MARVYLTEERERYFIEQIEDIFAESEPYFQKRIAKFKRMEALYMGDDYPAKATTVSGKAFPWRGRHEWNFALFPTLIDQWVSRLSQAIFSLSPIFLVLPAEYNVKPEDMESARKIQTFLDIYFHRIRLREKIEKLIFHLLLYGIGWIKIVWKPTSENVEEEFGEPEPLLIEPTIIVPRPANIMPVPTDVSSQDAIWCYVHKENLKWHEILERFKVGKYRSDRLKKLLEWSGTSAYTHQTEGTKPMTKTYPIYEFFLRDEEGNKYLIDYFRDAQLILDVVEYPFKNLDCPYILFNLLRSPFTIWGVSLAERFYDLVEASEITANQLANALDLLIVPPLIISGTSRAKEDEIIIAPKAVIPADTPQDIIPLTLPVAEAVQASMQLFNLYYQQLQRVSGISDIRMGLPKGISATEVMQTLSEGGALLQLTAINLLDKLALLPQKLLSVMKQYITSPIRIAGTKGNEIIQVEITPEDLDKDYVFYTQGIPYVPSTDKQKELVMLAYQLCAQNPLIAEDPVKLYYLTEEVLKTLGFKNIRLILGEPPSKTQVPQQPQGAVAGTPQEAPQEAGTPQAEAPIPTSDLATLLEQLGMSAPEGAEAPPTEE